MIIARRVPPSRPLLLTLFAILALTGVALPRTAHAADERDSEAPARVHLDVDGTFLNVGAAIAGHLGGRFYAGAGFSFFPSFVTMSSFDRYPVEMFDVHAFGRYELHPAAQIDLGVRVSRFEEVCVFGDCSPLGYLAGPYTGMAFGGRNFKIGPRIELAQRSDTKQWGVLFVPIMLRLQVPL